MNFAMAILWLADTRVDKLITCFVEPEGTMRLVRRRFLLQLAATIVVMPVCSRGWAQMYPARPVRLLVPYAPGGPTDILARLTARKLAEHLGQQFYVENVGGASGNIGIGRGAKAAPDGYTILIVPPNIVVNPALYGSVPYDPYKDFDPVTIAVTSTIVLTVHPSLPVQTVSDLVALIKANPGKYSYASPGAGTPPHLVAEQFRLSLGLEMTHLPFKSAGEAITSTVGGHTPIAFSSAPPAVPQVKQNRLRALAVTSNARSHVLPSVPTMSEAGYPEIAGEGWFAYIVPAGTPKEITALLNREIIKILAHPEIKERIASLGFEPVGSSAEGAAAQFRSEGARWTKVIREAGIKAD